MVSIIDNRDLRRSALDRRRVCRSSANVLVGSIASVDGRPATTGPVIAARPMSAVGRSLADIALDVLDVRFTPESGHVRCNAREAESLCRLQIDQRRD